MRVYGIGVRKTRLSLCVVISLVVLSACGLKVEHVALDEPPVIAPDVQPTPIGFNKIAFAVPTGTPVVSQSPKGILGLIECSYPYGLKPVRPQGRGFPRENWRRIFFETLEGQGYDVTGNPGALFDEIEDLQRTVYSIGGRITDLKMDVCETQGMFGVSRGIKGEASMTVEWTTFDLLNRKNVFRKVTKGYARTNNSNYEGVELLFEEALAAAVNNLGADQEFSQLVLYGEEPEELPGTIEDPYEQALSVYDPQEAIYVEEKPLFDTPAGPRIEALSSAAVMIQTTGHGSGFFITKQGHILTNAHVVGNAQRVRVVTAGKEEKLIAEVLRLDRKRDVAVLRLETVPDDLEIVTLPVRPEMPHVGEDVYAIGAPIYTRLQDTVTKGIVSAKRYDRMRKHWRIQADVTIHPGNSGGPLLDAQGNVIGLSVAGYIEGSTNLAGLNLFIPIADALEHLDIGYKESE